MSINKRFFKYVTQNIFGMLGLSFYILADTFFISKAQGADGITALNLVLPIYSLIFSMGAMIGLGAAIRYAIAKVNSSSNCHTYFFESLTWTLLISFPFIIVGFFFPEKLLALLGADEHIVFLATPYTRIFMCFATMFMWNHVCNAFVRNDGAPTVAMLATLISSLFNIAFDYILMFPFKMGMPGAALATALSPVVGICICLIHILGKNSHLKIKPCILKFSNLFRFCQVGVSAFIGEISSGIITMVFNFLILGLSGNTGVAAYGIVANTALVGISVFNGVAQGTQPLLSEYYGLGNTIIVNKLKKMSFILSYLLAGLLYFFLYVAKSPLAHLFNEAGDQTLQNLAEAGITLYFLGLFFAGVNIVGSSYFSSTAQSKNALILSICRGFLFILFFAFLFSRLFGMNGVWLSYPASELTTMIVMYFLLSKKVKSFE